MDTWFEEFFEGEWGARYPGSIDRERTRLEVETLTRLFEFDGPADLLDAPCGDGRHAALLAERGHRVCGLDASPAFLDHARRRAAEAGVELDLRAGDLRALPWSDAFDGAYCWFGSFGYFDEAGDRAHLEGVARALRPGGVFLLETLCMESLLPRFLPRDWEEDEHGLIVQQRRIDLDGGRIESHWRFQRRGDASGAPGVPFGKAHVSGATPHGVAGSGEWHESRSSIRLYTVRELRRLFRDCGFGEVELLDPVGEPFDLGADRVTVRARRPS